MALDQVAVAGKGLEDGLIFRSANFVRKKALFDVVVERRREEAVGLEVMARDGFAVEGVDDHGDGGDDALVGGGDEPGSPATF